MHVELYGSGVDFYVATPMYVVSNLYKREEGSLFAPMPRQFVKGVMGQLGQLIVVSLNFLNLKFDEPM
jgi:hypothetical protein